MKRVLKWSLIALGPLVLLYAALVGMRRPWVEPVPGVDLTPRLPLLRSEDVQPDSAFALLQQAVQLPPDVDWDHRVDDKLAERPWPVPLPEPVPAPDPEPVVVPSPEPVLPEKPPEPLDGDAAIAAAFPDPEEPPISMGGSMGTGMGMGMEPERFNPELPWTREEIDEIIDLLNRCEPNLVLARQAAVTPNPQVTTATNMATELQYLMGARELTRDFGRSAYHKACQGDLSGAFDETESALRLAQILSRGGVLINHLVTIACDQATLSTLWTITTREDHLPVECIRALMASLTELEETIEPLAEALRHEAATTEENVNMVYTRGGLNMMGATPRGANALFAVLPRLAIVFGSTPTRTRRNLESCYQHMVAIVEQDYDRTAWDDLKTGLRMGNPVDLLTHQDPVGLVLASIVLPAFPQAQQRDRQHHAAIRLMRTHLALRLHRQTTGTTPDALADLVPEYLASVPIDPFDDAAIRYRRLPDDQWILYSVGTDRRDDGGDGAGFMRYAMNPTMSGPTRRFTDLVVPSTNTYDPDAGKDEEDYEPDADMAQ